MREGFLEAAEAGDTQQLHRLAGLLWNCTDVVPNTDLDVSFGLSPGHTYAMVARRVRARPDLTTWDR
jgi:hypothetical protein